VANLARLPRPQIDAIGTKRYDSTSSGEKEIQRTMLELLNQLDGFDERSDVKVGIRGRGVEAPTSRLE
jgi:26S proteasome regulatory subunit T2